MQPIDKEARKHIMVAKRFASILERQVGSPKAGDSSLASINHQIECAEGLVRWGNANARISEPARIAGEIVKLRQRYEALSEQV